MQYLAAYTHKVAVTNRRIIDDTNDSYSCSIKITAVAGSKK